MKDILVIEDSNDVREVIVSTLARCGYFVRQASNGREGIQMVINQKPDLILCDVRMPGLDGHSTLATIRKCAGTAAIPFILMTGFMGQTDFRRAMVSGADDYLMKPFSAQELISAVNSRFERVAKLRSEGFRQMSEELAVRLDSLLPQIDAKARQMSFAKPLPSPTVQVEPPVYHLD